MRWVDVYLPHPCIKKCCSTFFVLVPQNVTLFGDKVFIEVIKLKVKWALIQYEWFHYKKERFEQRDRH